MRTAELRVFATLIVAISIIVAATYWLALAQDPLNLWLLLRGVLILVGAASCVALAFYALRKDWITYRRSLLDQVLTCVLAETPGLTQLPNDNLASPFVATVREHMDQLRSRNQQLQVQRKNLEIQLRLADAERRQSQTMINGISDAVIVTNGFDELIVANPVAADLFKCDLASSARKPLAEVIPLTKLVADISEMRQTHSRTNRRTLEYTFDHDGSPHTFTVTMTCVMDNADQLSGVVTVLHDTTREREIAAMKSEFVSHVSHELRTPLSSIKAYAELLVDGEAGDDKTRNEFYHIIQGEADRLSRLIDNILNISRIESGMTRVNKKSISLTAIIKEVLEVAMPSARDKQITLLDQVTPVFTQVDADRDMIYQAALNLVSNAIKYTPANGTVKVAVQMDEERNQVKVLVTDTGVGIPPDAMKHLFEKFYRVEQHKSMAKGSGLGLNLTRQIIENVHKGKMLVDSTPGKGSTFGFALPINQ